MPFGLSLEHLVILAIILIIVGPSRIPDVARSLGKTYKNFKDAVDGVREAAYKEVTPPEDPKELAAKKKAEEKEEDSEKP